MRFLAVFAVSLWGSATYADPISSLMTAARDAYDEMPVLRVVDRIAGECGAHAEVNPQIAYCTTQNAILITRDAATTPKSAYLVAHQLGHAVQVQHGVADVALREIRARRDEEPVLRGYVARQVDCIAGFLYQRAGLPAAALTDRLSVEPFTGSHWGRNPLQVGPHVSIGLAERGAWFQRGQSGDMRNCGVSEFGPEQLLNALRD